MYFLLVHNNSNFIFAKMQAIQGFDIRDLKVIDYTWRECDKEAYDKCIIGY